MASVVFPTTAAIPNTVPANGNTVPIFGTQAIINHSEGLLFFAVSMENIFLGDEINFGRGALPRIQINKAVSQSGDIYTEVIAYIKMRPDYATFPDGLKFWKCAIDALPTNPANSNFNV